MTCFTLLINTLKYRQAGLILCVTAFLFMLFNSCSYHNELELYPCDSTGVSYSKSIQPILENHCYSCHSDANKAVHANNFGLEGYNQVKSIIDLNQGLIIGNIRHDPGFMAMPKGAPKLSECDIAKIQSWISKGAPND